MRTLGVFLALSSLFWGLKACRAGDDTLAALLCGHPELAKATSMLQSQANIWQQLESPGANLTLFVASDAGLEAANSSAAWRLEASQDQSNNSDLALAQYALLPGVYNLTALVEAPSINTGLGVILRRDYPLAFERLQEGTVIMKRPWDEQGDNAKAVILKQYTAGNGILYQVDRPVTPSGYTSDPIWYIYGATNTTMADATNCGGNNVITVAGRLPGRYLRQATWALYGLKPMLEDPAFSATIFLTTDESLRSIMRQNNVTDADMMKYQQAHIDPLMYQMLPGAYCPEELIEAGTVEPDYAQERFAGYPLKFSLQKDTGQLVVTGRSGPSAVVTGVEFACNSVIMLLDGFIMPFAPGNVSGEVHGSVVPGAPPITNEQLFRGSNNEPDPRVNLSSLVIPKVLPSGPPRHMACLPPPSRQNASLAALYQYVEGGAPGASPSNADAPSGGSDGSASSGGGGSNTGVIAGAAAGAAAAVLLAAAAAALLLRRRRRRRLAAKTAAAGGDSLDKMGRADSLKSSDLEAGGLGGSGALPGTGTPSLVAVGELASIGGLLRLPSRPFPNPGWYPAASTVETGTQSQSSQHVSRSTTASGAASGVASGSGTAHAGHAGTPRSAAGSEPDASCLPWANMGGVQPPPSPFVAPLPQPLGREGLPGPSPWGPVRALAVGGPMKAPQQAEQAQQEQQQAAQPSRPASAGGSSYGGGQLDLRKLSSLRTPFAARAELEGRALSRGDSAADQQPSAVSASSIATAAVHPGSPAPTASVSSPLSAAPTTPFSAGASMALPPTSSGDSSGFLNNGWGSVFTEYAGAAANGAALAKAKEAKQRTYSLQDATGKTRSDVLAAGGSTQPSWELDPKAVSICTHSDGALVELGGGAFGKVYQGLLNGITPVAVKILHRDAQRDAMADLANEVEILKACQHPSIVQFLGACLQSQWLMLVTEFMPGRDLARSITLPQFRWYARGRRCALDILRGLVFLHENGVVHFDLKSNNILISADGTAKIADMGLSRFLSQSYLSHTAALGTFAYASPEQILGLRCSAATDMYSVGVLLWELVTGEMPLRGHLRNLEAPQDCPQAVADLIETCLEANPKLRPTAQQAFVIVQEVQ
ncbi:hypothetical protein N2152v2_005267 [Parachlorella kessleri]